MRTVLDREIVVFEEGFQAFQSGVLRQDNPYPGGSDDRNNWFKGWDHGLHCRGMCND